MIRQSYDIEADALYIRLTGNKIATTAQIDAGTLVDLDGAGRVVGIEVISPEREWPVLKIVSRFRIVGEDAEQLLAYFSAAAHLAPTAPHPGATVPVRIPAVA